MAARYPFVWNLPAVSPEEDASRHAPVLDRMLELIRRGQRSGDLDNTLPPDWLLTASLAVGRAVQDEVKAGRMTVEEASRVVQELHPPARHRRPRLWTWPTVGGQDAELQLRTTKLR